MPPQADMDHNRPITSTVGQREIATLQTSRWGSRGHFKVVYPALEGCPGEQHERAIKTPEPEVQDEGHKAVISADYRRRAEVERRHSSATIMQPLGRTVGRSSVCELIPSISSHPAPLIEGHKKDTSHDDASLHFLP